MTINYSKQVLLKRGNTAVSSTYVGPLGEVTYDTDLHQIRVHDGERAGGWIVPGGPEYDLLVPLIGNAAVQQTQINSLFANANVQQAFIESIVNQGNVDPGTGNETFWFNTEDGRLYIKQANVWIDSSPMELPNPSYINGIMEDFAGNIVPAANVTYSLGTQEAQWKDLWVSNNTIYIGNTPITVSNGSLLVGGNVISGGGNAFNQSLNTGDSVTFNSVGATIINVSQINGTNPGNELVIQADNRNWTFGTDGNLTFPANLSIGYVGNYIPVDGTIIRQADNEWLEIRSNGVEAVTTIGWTDDFGGGSGNVAEISFNNFPGQARIVTGQYGEQINTWQFRPDGTTTFPNNTIKAPDGSELRLYAESGNNYSVTSHTGPIWEAYVEDEGTGANVAWAWIQATLADGVNRPEVFIENKRGDDGVEVRWTFDASGILSIPGAITLDTNSESTQINISPNGEGAAFLQIPNTDTADIDNTRLANTLGNVTIETGAGSWTFDADGNLTLPAGGTITEGGGLTGAIRLTPNGGANAEQALLIYPTAGGEGDHIHLTAGGGSTELYLGNDFHYVKLVDGGNIEIRTNDLLGNAGTWYFGTDGTLTLPGKLWARASDSGSIAFTNDGTTERGYLKVDAGYNMVVNAESNYYVKRNGTDRLAIESNYTTIRSGTATRIETNLVGTSRTYTFGETGILGLPYDSYLESTPARNLNLGAWGNISIIANAQSNSTTSWIFGADGDLTLPGNIKGATGTGPVTVTSNDGATDYNWTFGTDGKLTAPGKIQTTDTTNSISTTTGALIVGGGAGIQSDVHIGGTVRITDTTPSEDYTTGALVVDGGIGVNGNINLSGNINILNGNINIQEFTGSTGNFYGDVVTGFNAFYAGKSGFTALPYTVAQFSTTSNTYSQINMENTSTGKLASADFVGTADIGTDASWFFDIGIANSGYDPVLAAENNAPGTSVEPLDTYFYVQGNVDVPNTGGNLTIGTSQIGKVVKFIAGGTNTANVIMTVTETGVVVTKNLTAPNLGYAADVASANAAIITANTAMKGYVDAQIASIPGGTTYSNANVAAYLITNTGNVSVGNLAIASNSSAVRFPNGSSIYGDAGILNRTGSIVLQPAASGTFPGVIIGGAGRLIAPNGSVHQIFNASDVTFQVAAKVIAGTASTSTTTGALIITGGAGFSGNIYSGGLASITGNITGGNIATAGQISATGNVTTSGKFVGDGSLLTNVTVNAAGNIQGSGTNVNLVAGNYTYTFDNTGIVTLPAAASGNEGGEIDFGKAPSSSLSGTSVVVDQYVDRLRFFESGGTNRGVYIDLTQAAAGVGTLLNNRVSGFVNAGAFVTMDNIKATVTTGGNRGLSLATVSGSFTYNIAATYALSNSTTGGAVLVGQTLTTSATTSIFGWNFGNTGEMQTYIITNTSSLLTYRITVMIGASYNNNMISIERLI